MGLAGGYRRAATLAEEQYGIGEQHGWGGSFVERLRTLQSEAEDSCVDAQFATPKGVVGTD